MKIWQSTIGSYFANITVKNELKLHRKSSASSQSIA